MIKRNLSSALLAVFLLAGAAPLCAQTEDQLRAEAEAIGKRISDSQFEITKMRADYNRIMDDDYLPAGSHYGESFEAFGQVWTMSGVYAQVLIGIWNNGDGYVAAFRLPELAAKIDELRAVRAVEMAKVRDQIAERERELAGIRDQHIAVLDRVIAGDYSDSPVNQVQTGSALAGTGSADKAPDLSKSWSSNYGRIDFAAGWYGASQHPISAGAPSFDGSNYVVRGTWGDAGNESNTGGFEFVFSDSCSFTGTWWRDSSPNKIEAEPWNGSC